MLLRSAAALAALVLASATGCTAVPLEQADALRAVTRPPLGRPVLSFRWKKSTSDRLTETRPQEFASALVWRDTAFIGSEGGTFYALAAKDGRVRWKTPIGAVSATPVVDRGWIYVGTDDGEMVCLDAQTGAVKWRYASRGPIEEAAAVSGNLVIFSNEADQVYALDALTGAFRWQYKGETPEEYTLRGHAGVALDGDLVFTGFANGSMVALRAENGSVAWLTSLKGGSDRFVDVDATPVVVHDTVYVTSSSGGAYALDKTTGLVRWRLPLVDTSQPAASPGNAGGVASDGERVYVAAADQGVYALDFEGNILWRQGTRGGGEPAPPVVSGNYVLYTLAGDGIFIADKRTGDVLQWFNPGDGVSGAPTVTDDDRLFLLSNHGLVYAFDVTRF